MDRDALLAAVTATPADQLPAVIGDLDAAKAAAWARLTAPSPDTSRDAVPAGRNITVEAAAERLGVSTGYIYRNAKKLPFIVRAGRRMLCDPQRVEKWNRQRGNPDASARKTS